MLHDIISDVIPDIMSEILSDILHVFNVAKLARLLEHKLRLENAHLKAQGFDAILSSPKEELHQFLIGLCGDHLLPTQCMRLRKF